MNDFKKYLKNKPTELRPFVPGETLGSHVSIGEADRATGSPKAGDMIARNPEKPGDEWLVAEAYFTANYVEAPVEPSLQELRDIKREGLGEVATEGANAQA